MQIDLYNGNCLRYLEKLPNESVDLILTDPPYLISKESNFHKGGSWNNSSDKAHRKTPPKTDFGEWDKIDLDLDIILKAFYRILKSSGSIIIFYDMWKIQELKEIAESNGFKQLRLCRWDKTNPIPVNSKLNYLSNSSEYFITAVKGSKPTFHSEYDKGIYTFPICSGKERTTHPTQKPLVLIQTLIEKHSNMCDTILDPFMGSGTTGVACINTNRNFIGAELDFDYFKIAQERISQAKSKWLDNLLGGIE